VSDPPVARVDPDVSQFFFWVRWVLASGLGLCALGFVAWAVGELFRGEGVQAAVFSVLALVLGVPAVALQPGIVSPREQARQAEATREVEASPRFQLGQAREGRVRLEAHLATLEPLRKKYEREQAGYLEKLGPAIKKAGVKSHRELLERGGAEHEITTMLHRAAVLERALPLLVRRSQDASQTIAALSQKEWELEHMIELEAVASRAELDEVRRILAHAESLVDERVGVPEKQDVAELEAGLFNRLAGAR
jgi:hypothetical protein